MPLQCPYCDTVWQPKVKEPRACPKCKRYFTKDKQPVYVDRQVIQERLQSKLPAVAGIKSSIAGISPESYVNCSVCGKRAVVNVFGKNVCMDHAKTLFEDQVRSKIEAKKIPVEELMQTQDLPYDEFLHDASRAISTYDDFVEIAKREANRRALQLSDVEIEQLCQSVWGISHANIS